MPEAEFVIADVFAAAPFEGNQLAVFVDGQGLDDRQMQRAANEMGYSETTFLLPPESPDTDLRIRIFTPHVELPFAGHPLVGSGFVAAVRRLVPCDPQVLRFGTGVGTIEVRPELESNRSGRAWMRQPFPVLVEERTDPEAVDALAAALGVYPSQMPLDRSPIAVMDNGLRMMVVPLDSLATVRDLDPNPKAVARACASFGAKTILLFATETVKEHSSSHCRVFAPGAGVHEDPATGSANGAFGVYLRRYGLVDTDEIENEQGYEMGRPSALRVSLGRDAEGELVEVTVGGGVFVTGEGRMFL